MRSQTSLHINGYIIAVSCVLAGSHCAALCLQPPSISGRYTGSAFRNFMGPAKGDYDRMMASLGAMVKSACSLLRGDGQGSYAQLKEDIKALEANRWAHL